MLHTLLLLMLITKTPTLAGLPSADEVVVRMMQRDTERHSQLEGYRSVRRYALENVKHNKRAEMLVRMTYHQDGLKEFEIVSSSGWGGARKYVFPRLLEAETEASRPGNPEDSRVTSQNYSFTMLRADEVDGRKSVCNRGHPEQEKEISDPRYDLGRRRGFRDRSYGRRPGEKSVVLDQERPIHSQI